MDVIFDGGFPLSLLTKTKGQPPNWDSKWRDFQKQQTGRAHNDLGWYEIPVWRELAKQQYIFFVVKPQMEKDQKRNTFTLWENAHSHNPSICGVYLSYLDLYTKYRTSGAQNKYTISFPVVFNFDDLLPFLTFNEFPNCIFGQFSLTVRVIPEALVWCL
jgi:hypothetical protein